MKIGFTPDNKTQRGPDYPKLMLDHGASARICVVDAEPEMLYIHSLKMPVVQDGKMVTAIRKGTGGREDREEVVTEFVGQFLCHGDLETVQKNDIDPAKCEACADVERDPDKFDPPKRRFAQHVLWYETKPGTFQVQTPFQAKLVVWVYPEGRFNSLVDFAQEHGDLRKKDLLLGPCENKAFQKYEMKVGAKAEWLEDDARKQFVADLYKNNKCENLEAMIGRTATPLQIKTDAAKVRQRFAQLGSAPAAAATEQALGDDVLSAISGAVDSAQGQQAAAPAPTPAPEAAPAPAPEPAADLDSLAGVLGDEPAAEAAPAPAPEEAKSEPEDTADELDFAKILDGV